MRKSFAAPCAAIDGVILRMLTEDMQLRPAQSEVHVVMNRSDRMIFNALTGNHDPQHIASNPEW